MNVSLLRDSKLLHGQERRGSRISVRMPSRQPSMASLRPHSPNPSLGKQGLYSPIYISSHLFKCCTKTKCIFFYRNKIDIFSSFEILSDWILFFFFCNVPSVHHICVPLNLIYKRFSAYYSYSLPIQILCNPRSRNHKS